MRIQSISFNGIYKNAYKTAQPKFQSPARDTVNFKAINAAPAIEKMTSEEDILTEAKVLRTKSLNRFYELQTTIREDKYRGYKTTKSSTRDVTRVYKHDEDNNFALIEYDEKGRPVRKTEFTHFSFATDDGKPEIAKNGIPIGTPAITSIEEYTNHGTVKYNYDVPVLNSNGVVNEVLYDYKETKNSQSAAKKVTYSWRDDTARIAIAYRKSNGKETAEKIVEF